MATQSKSLEKTEVQGQKGLKKSFVERDQNRVTPIEAGRYLVLPMEHFTSKSTYNGQEFDSNRLLIFKVNEGQTGIDAIRSFKLSNLNASLAVAEGAEVPVLEPVTRNGRERVPANVLNYTLACTDYIPHTINTKKDASGEDIDVYHIDQALFIDIKDRIKGYNPKYETEDNLVWDVATDEDGHIIFEEASILPFSVAPEKPKADLIKKAKEALARDEQFKDVKVD